MIEKIISSPMYALVSSFSQSFDDLGVTYKIPKNLEDQIFPGVFVSIPFGRKILIGVVLDVLKTSNIPENKLKEILKIYPDSSLLLPLHIIKLMRFIGVYYFCLIHQSATLFIPKNMLGKLEKEKFFITKAGKKHLYTFEKNYSLNPLQQEIFEKIISQKSQKKFLLYGVTGSGKTQIYIDLIKKYLDEGKQSLLLVPEIILTNQIFERIQRVFGKEVLVIHSAVSEAKKTSYWEDIFLGNAKIIIGTRSSIFYPYKNLGIIIVDEEHDNSYISDNAPRYNTIDIALKYSDLTDCRVVLGSGTPKISHMYKGLKGEFEVLSLLSEYVGK